MVTLENNRVLLRPITSADYEYLLPYALHEPHLWQYSLICPRGAAGMRTYIDEAVAATVAGIEQVFVVYDKATEQYVGSTRFYGINAAHRSALIGYTWYGSAFHRTGINRHCKLLLLTYAFEVWELARVEFRADTRNARSIAAMQAIGCTVEGVLRSDRLRENSTARSSSIVLSILREEWFGGVKEALQQKTQ